MKYLIASICLCLLFACGKKEENVFSSQTRALDKAKQTEQKLMKAVDQQKKMIEKNLQQ